MVSTMNEYRKRMSWIYSLLGGKCVICGSSIKLHVHHLFDKKFCIAKNWSLSKEKLKLELKKCELRCKDCHMATHTRPHGTEARYRHSRCRCKSCIEAHRLRMIKYRRDREAREPGYRRVG